MVGQSMGRPEGLTVVDETLLAQQAIPLFDGHQQPITYCLDADNTRWDDGDEAAMDLQVGLAQDAGLDFFVFDSYEGTKGGMPTTEAEGPAGLFRKLAVGGTMKYAKMQTFASPRVVLPVSKDPDYHEPGRLYDTDKRCVQYIVDTCVKNDWTHPNYVLVDDRPYMSLFIPDMTPGWSGRMQRMPTMIGELREYANRKYKINPYLVGCIRTLTQAEELTRAGVDALTGYAFLPDFGEGVPPIQNYEDLVQQRRKDWGAVSAIHTFVPPAVVGWDASPRGKSVYQLGSTYGNAYAPIVVGGSPRAFENMLYDSLVFTNGNVPEKERYGIVCAWNELTEGAALLPRMNDDRSLDTSYLDAVRRATSRLEL